MTGIQERVEALSRIGNDPVRHLRYYRHCLADGERMDIPAEAVREKGCLVPADGALTEDLVRKLFEDLPEEEKSRDILYCPLSIQKAMADGVKGRDVVVYPYWIPAVLGRKGDLRPPREDADIPWLVRGVLSPNEYLNREYPVLSSVERVDHVGTTLQISRATWEEYHSGALKYFKDQVGSEVKGLSVEDWDVRSDRAALYPADLRGLAAALLQMYDRYAVPDAAHMPGTLRSLLTPRRASPETITDPAASALKSRHYGQMADRFPLSPSQRVGLSLLDRCGIYQVLAVNGPPGTGKTTLIQSVAADLLVKAFLRDGKPPVIVGSSANNKAITNILDSFASVSPRGEDRANLNQRWLPDLDPLGQYLAANMAEKIESARRVGHWVSTCGTQGLDAYQEYCAAHPKEECEEYFLRKLRAESGSPDDADLRKALDRIRETVTGLCGRVDDVTQSLGRLREACRAPEFRDLPIVSLVPAVDARLKSVREKREPLDELIQRESLRPSRPGFLGRWIESRRYGPPELRRARVQAELLKKGDGSLDLDQPDVYALGAEIWRVRDGLFRTELNLSRTWAEISPDYDTIAPCLADLDPAVTCGSDEWIEAAQGRLDTEERHRAFWWALHGFEAQWLLQRDDKSYRELNQGEPQSLERLAQRSYLTPVFVSTFHSLPHFLSYSKKTPDEKWTNVPLTGSVDLLVVDEAGQVAPELGVPVFGLAKRALVVGDVRQLEPIWSIPSRTIDYSNGRRAGIVASPEDYEAFFESRRGGVNGSLMALAQDASAFLYPPPWKEAGSLLVEHRRCVPGVIEYSNRFVYESLLDVKTRAEESEWPALGYCHIPGESRKFRGSQSNSLEARAVAAWIHRNREKLTGVFGAKLGDALAVVTPFRAQQAAILDALKALGVDGKVLVVGTVHALQGAEKPVVLFSPVYGRNHSGGSLFFNQSYNMLNVATSRAKKHFFVFGNMALFKAEKDGTPASDLGRLLFRSPDNELPNDFLFREDRIEFFEREPVDRLDTLQKHRASLKRAFEIAEKRLVIVSPFISNAALQADGIPALVSAAVRRGVEVLILTDASLDQSQGALRPQAEAGRKALSDAGANLTVLSGIHNKTLILDRRVLIEGSFNWLSAVRDENSQYNRYETSIVIKAPQCERFIDRAENELGLPAIEDSE